MHRRMGWLVGVALAGLWVGGCQSGDANGPQGPMAGSWLGSASGLDLSMTLKDNSGKISGSGSFAVPGAALKINVSGTRADTTVTLTLSAQEYQPAQYVALMMNDTTVSGTLNGSGFGTFFITVHKQ